MAWVYRNASNPSSVDRNGFHLLLLLTVYQRAKGVGQGGAELWEDGKRGSLRSTSCSRAPNSPGAQEGEGPPATAVAAHGPEVSEADPEGRES